MTMPDDRDLEKLLSDDGGEWGALYRKLSRVEPPRRLDRNVLGEAARAVHGHVPRRQRWLVGFGSAAGIVLAAGIAWHVGHQAMPPSAAPAPAQEAPAASAPRRQYVPVQTFDESARRAAPKADTPAAPSMTAPASAPPPPAAAKTRPPTPAQEKAASAPAPVPEASPRLEKKEAIAPTTTPRATVADDAMQGAASKAAAASNATVAPAPAEDAELRANGRARDASPEALTRSQEIHNDMRLPPDAWIRRIQWLLDEGRDDQALESLRLLRRTHPNVELPADLKDLQ